MKCPKCGYLGFETGDRCRNCGYDFALMAATPSAPAADPGGPPAHGLPLFDPGSADDAPLVALPPAPRAPLSVRRTPETSRLRTIPRVAREPASALNFHEEPERTREADAADVRSGPPERDPHRSPGYAAVTEDGSKVAGRRIAALIVDHAILLAIDAAVLYFTLKMAGLTMAEVAAVPLTPLALFLVLLQLAYFSAFTAVGGQTIGKMAAGIRVVAVDDRPLDGVRAIRRTLAGLLSYVTLGIGFVPALVGADRRALHDRLSGTRVVSLHSV